MSLADHSDSQRVADRLKSSTRQLHKLATQVGHAKMVREYDADRRKAILSVEVVKELKNGQTATAAEHLARSSATYGVKLQELSVQYDEAERIIAEWSATQASFECARSLLSFEKATMRDL